MYSLKLEWIGENIHHKAKAFRMAGREFVPQRRIDVPRRPWVARLLGRCRKHTFQREFVKGLKDFASSNSVGSRGVFLYFHLDDGLYEVHELVTWDRADRYYLRIINGRATRLRLMEAIQCLT